MLAGLTVSFAGCSCAAHRVGVGLGRSQQLRFETEKDSKVKEARDRQPKEPRRCTKDTKDAREERAALGYGCRLRGVSRSCGMITLF